MHRASTPVEVSLFLVRNSNGMPNCFLKMIMSPLSILNSSMHQEPCFEVRSNLGATGSLSGKALRQPPLIFTKLFTNPVTRAARRCLNLVKTTEISAAIGVQLELIFGSFVFGVTWFEFFRSTRCRRCRRCQFRRSSTIRRCQLRCSRHRQFRHRR
jgi:hypothetical protein